jgi:hypothetical protein
VGAGRGCGKAWYGTVVRPLHVFQGEAHSGFQRCEARRCGESERCRRCRDLTCHGQWSVGGAERTATVYWYVYRMDSRSVRRADDGEVARFCLVAGQTHHTAAPSVAHWPVTFFLVE